MSEMTATEEIFIGTVVEFKSGGPRMTVIKINQMKIPATAVRLYFDEIRRWQTQEFPIAT